MESRTAMKEIPDYANLPQCTTCGKSVRDMESPDVCDLVTDETTVHNIISVSVLDRYEGYTPMVFCGTECREKFAEDWRENLE